MRRLQHSLASAREELVNIEQEFTQLQKRIKAVRDSASDALVPLFGALRPAFIGLDEVALIGRITSSVVARLPTPPEPQPHEENWYVRQKEAAAFLGVSVSPLRSWRSRVFPAAPLYAHGQDGDVFREGVGAIHGTANCWKAVREQG